MIVCGYLLFARRDSTALDSISPNPCAVGPVPVVRILECPVSRPYSARSAGQL